MNGLVLEGSTPELFRQHVRDALTRIQAKPQQHRLVFLKSWNEWAEGNHMEPDLRFGLGYLEALRSELLASEAGEEDIRAQAEVKCEPLPQGPLRSGSHVAPRERTAS
jgi:hypothetical protein